VTAGELDLGPALKDAYLRKTAFGKNCETVELTFHVMRRHLAPREKDADRIYGFRFRGVRALAQEAVRWDRDAGKWVHAKLDWLGALARDQMERPIIGNAFLNAPATLERWTKAAENALWLRGQPANLDLASGGIAANAPAVFEISCEVILPNGMNANARVFIAADELEVVSSRGAIAPALLVQMGDEWVNHWRQYWARKERRPELPDDPQFAWLVPEGGE
jgi:hypothetical protein